MKWNTNVERRLFQICQSLSSAVVYPVQALANWIHNWWTRWLKELEESPINIDVHSSVPLYPRFPYIVYMTDYELISNFVYNVKTTFWKSWISSASRFSHHSLNVQTWLCHNILVGRKGDHICRVFLYLYRLVLLLLWFYRSLFLVCYVPTRDLCCFAPILCV